MVEIIVQTNRGRFIEKIKVRDYFDLTGGDQAIRLMNAVDDAQTEDEEDGDEES